MGRWSQRRHCGGGEPYQLNRQMTSAHIQTGVSLVISYSAPVTDGGFTGTEFTSHPSGEVSGSVGSVSDTELEVDFGGSVLTDTSVTYAGTVVNIVTPQTIAIT